LLNEIFTACCDLIFLGSHFRPVNLPFANVVKDCLDCHVSKGRISYDHLIGDDSQRKPVYGFSCGLSSENFRSNVVWRSIEGVDLLDFLMFYHFAEVEICKDKLSIFVNNYIVLNS